MANLVRNEKKRWISTNGEPLNRPSSAYMPTVALSLFNLLVAFAKGNFVRIPEFSICMIKLCIILNYPT